MKAVFLADAHLKNSSDESYRSLMEFLDSVANINQLYLVGDVFDFWFSRNGRVYEEFIPIIEKLAELHTKGVHVIFCEGNHDFYLESYFSARLGMTVFADWARVNLDGRKILVSHGDLVDTTNSQYLCLRKILRSRIVYLIQRNIPLPVLWKIARSSSIVSKKMSTQSQICLTEKMEAFSQEKFHEGFDAVILGHCHKPLIKEYVIDGRKRTFATLGDWPQHHSYLCYEDGRFTLQYYRGHPAS